MFSLLDSSSGTDAVFILESIQMSKLLLQNHRTKIFWSDETKTELLVMMMIMFEGKSLQTSKNHPNCEAWQWQHHDVLQEHA